MSHYKLAILCTNQRVDQVPEGEENEESCHLRYREFLDQDRRCGRESMASSQQHANEKDEDRHMVSYLGTSRQTIYKNMTTSHAGFNSGKDFMYPLPKKIGHIVLNNNINTE